MKYQKPKLVEKKAHSIDESFEASAAPAIVAVVLIVILIIGGCPKK